MATVVLELNDVGVSASAGAGVRFESPGFAMLEGKQVLVGEDARARARLNPRATYDQFWAQLSLDPLAGRSSKVQHHGDLAYLHLAQLWERLDAETRAVMLAVPGTFDKAQLGLLLGIAQALAMPVVGVVDAAVAAASQAAAQPRVLHLDIQLHRAVITRLEGETRLARAGVEQIPRAGLAPLFEAWIETLAEVFVRNTRFDPMHRAETEQALYDRLPAWLAELEDSSSATLELTAGAKTHRVTCSRERLTEAVAEPYRRLAQAARAHLGLGEPTTILVSHRLARLPGLCEALGSLPDCALTVLVADAAARGALAHERDIRSQEGSLRFVTSLPVQVTAAPAVAAAESAATQAPPAVAEPAAVERLQPTHIVYRGRAYPLGPRPLAIGAGLPEGQQGLDVGADATGVAQRHCSLERNGVEARLYDHSAQGTFVNDARVDASAALHAGDTLRLGSTELYAIAVVGDDGA